MTDPSAKIQLSERSWVPLGVTAALAAATGGGGFATAMWIMTTLYGVKDDVRTAAAEGAKGLSEVTGRLGILERRFDDVLAVNAHSLTTTEFKNWTLRLEMANKGTLQVPPVEK